MIVRRLTVAPEAPSESFGPGVIGDFTKVGDATMQVASGLLSTADVTQVDAVLGTVSWGIGGLLLSESTINGAPTYSPINNWGGIPLRWPTLFEVNDTSQVAGYVGTGGVDNQGNTGITGNKPGDMLVVRNSGPFISDSTPPDYKRLSDPPRYGWSGDIPFDPVHLVTILQDVYVWDGANWVLAWQWAGPATVTGAWYSANGSAIANWNVKPVPRPQPAHPGIYAYQWTKPGMFADGVRFRVRVKIAPAVSGSGVVPSGQPSSGLTGFGLCMNMVDADHGLMWAPWEGLNEIRKGGWTKRPSDLREWGAHYLPERVQSDGTYCFPDEQPLGGTQYADADPAVGQNGPAFYATHPGSTGDLWAEVWRQGNTAYGALYQDDPEALGANAVWTSAFAEDLTGGPYADGQAGYFGIVFNWLNPYAGLVSCEVVEPA